MRSMSVPSNHDEILDDFPGIKTPPKRKKKLPKIKSHYAHLKKIARIFDALNGVANDKEAEKHLKKIGKMIEKEKNK